MKLGLLFFCFISLVGFFYTAMKVILIKNNSVSRLNFYLKNKEQCIIENSKGKKETNATLERFANSIGKTKGMERYLLKTQANLGRASIKLRAQEFIALKIILIIFALFISMILSSISVVMILVSVIMMFLAIKGPSIYINSKIKKRHKKINTQLCEAITLISNSLKAGFSFFQAIDVLIKEMNGPVSEEFFILQKEIGLGLSTEVALENMVDRVKSDDLELVITAVLIQRQVGGNLAEILDSISATIRDRIRIKGEIKTVTAQGRMSGMIISLLPVGILLILLLINPEHVKLLFTNTIGIVMFAYCCFMEFLGIMMIKKIVDIRV